MEIASYGNPLKIKMTLIERAFISDSAVEVDNLP